MWFEEPCPIMEVLLSKYFSKTLKTMIEIVIVKFWRLWAIRLRMKP